MLLKGQERVGDRKRLDIEGEAEGRGGRRTRAESSAESILAFGSCPTFLLSLFVRIAAMAAADRSKARAA